MKSVAWFGIGFKCACVGGQIESDVKNVDTFFVVLNCDLLVGLGKILQSVSS